jgi:hypothetical protein
VSLKPHNVNTQNNFIGGWYLQDNAICDELIEYHISADDKHEGLMTGSGGAGRVDKASKESIDVTLPQCDLSQRYIKQLFNVAREFITLYPYCDKLVPWNVIEPMGVQYYKPGGGYKIWHFERDNRSELIARRHLAFMTYLNDVHEGGGTQFMYQDLTVKAEKGLTLIWPSEWTHTHKGEVSETEEKYIITGWFSTYTKDEFNARFKQ